MKPYNFFFASPYFVIFSILSLSACTSTHNNSGIVLTAQSPEQRSTKLQQIEQWQIKGKIAFIEKNKRNSATVNWQVNEKNNSQYLNLTSYLGINVLQLTTLQGNHSLIFDGKTYNDNNLKELIFSLTGLTLPTQALNYWLKGLPFESTDEVFYDSSHLPLSLDSSYNGEHWQVSFADYEQIDQVMLAKKITVTKDNLLIKIAINEWNIIE